MNQTHISPIMSIQQVANYLQVSDSTIYKLAKAGKLPGRKVGGKWRFSRDALDRWLLLEGQKQAS